MSGVRRSLRVTAAALVALVAGAIAGLIGALATPAHVEIAGADAQIRLHVGRSYDELSLSGVLTGKRATTRALAGEPVGVGISLQLDASTFTTSDGSFDANVLPAYIQAYSDPEQLAHELQWAVTKHALVWCGTCAALALGVLTAGSAYRSRRARRDRVLDSGQRRLVRAYWAPERAFARRVATGAVIVLTLSAVPSGTYRPPHRPTITGNPSLADTPLAGTQVGGLLRPALTALESYIRTYFSDTVSYYDTLEAKLVDQLDAGTVVLPEGDDVEHLLFVTDRHCNIGMDRVIVALAEHFGITVLVSSGDDAFSGSFAFEAACTANLASKSQEAGMTDVFVGGNHDSPTTLAKEAEQKIKVLDSGIMDVDGLRFVGVPDPRTSRYGKGIEPASSAAQARLIRQQGEAAGKLACGADGPVIVVLHDPAAGQLALRSGCGKARVALDGHTHVQSGPTPVPLADGVTGYQFTGASTGGAPTEQSVVRTFASRLTVGPLNHDATINIVSVDRSTGALLQVNECHITPEQDITFEQQSPS